MCRTGAGRFKATPKKGRETIPCSDSILRNQNGVVLVVPSDDERPSGQKSPDNKNGVGRVQGVLICWSGKSGWFIWCTRSRPCAAGPRRRGKGWCGGQGGSRGGNSIPLYMPKMPSVQPSAAEHPVQPPVHEALRGGRGRAERRSMSEPTRSLTSVGCILGFYLHPHNLLSPIPQLSQPAHTPGHSLTLP